MIALQILLALTLDALCGEPRRWHPLVGFGQLTSKLEALLRREGRAPQSQKLAGLLGWLLLVPLPALILWWLLELLSDLPTWLLMAAQVLVLYFTLGNRSLAEHARAIITPLLSGNLTEARFRVSMIVSRDTARLDKASVARAAVESVLENGSDAVLAPLFWFAVAGAPGALLYRLANTLDARWGYRSDKYLHFGRAAARCDDVLNWIPARLCALSYALTGNLRNALRCWREQAPQAASPNAGPVMAAGAGALNIRLGGPTDYHGQTEWRPTLGTGHVAEPRDIHRALHLLWRATALWLVIIVSAEISLSKHLTSRFEGTVGDHAVLFWHSVARPRIGVEAFETRREYIPVGSYAASLPHTVSKASTPTRDLSLYQSDRMHFGQKYPLHRTPCDVRARPGADGFETVSSRDSRCRAYRDVFTACLEPVCPRAGPGSEVPYIPSNLGANFQLFFGLCGGALCP